MSRIETYASIATHSYNKTLLEQRRCAVNKMNDRLIDTGEEVITLGQATDEQFDMFVYRILGLLYGDVIKVYNRRFAKMDWGDIEQRCQAIALLRALITGRKSSGDKQLPKVKLFVEE